VTRDPSTRAGGGFPDVPVTVDRSTRASLLKDARERRHRADLSSSMRPGRERILTTSSLLR
jgi:hypothetical protein